MTDLDSNCNVIIENDRELYENKQRLTSLRPLSEMSISASSNLQSTPDIETTLISSGMASLLSDKEQDSVLESAGSDVSAESLPVGESSLHSARSSNTNDTSTTLQNLDQADSNVSSGILTNYTLSSSPILDNHTTSPTIQPYLNPLGKLLEIRPSSNAGKQRGLGVFALSAFPCHTILIWEKPLLHLQYPLNSPCSFERLETDPIDEMIESLPAKQRTDFLALHRFSARKNVSKNPNREIIWTNGFSVGVTDNGPGSATGIFKVICRMNHSCRPNSHWIWRESLGSMIVRTIRDVAAGEEITISYGNTRDMLRMNFGFVCDCESCSEIDSQKEDWEYGGYSGSPRLNEKAIDLDIFVHEYDPNETPRVRDNTAKDNDDELLSSEKPDLYLREGKTDQRDPERGCFQNENKKEEDSRAGLGDTPDVDLKATDENAKDPSYEGHRLIYEFGEYCANDRYQGFGLYEKSEHQSTTLKDRPMSEGLSSTQTEVACEDTKEDPSLPKRSYRHDKVDLQHSTTNGYFKIMPSFNKDGTSRGHGIFATVNIPQETTILSETPLIVLPPVYDENTTCSAIGTLSAAQRHTFYSLHAHPRHPEYSLERQICSTNRFQWRNECVAIFNIISRFNHACCPNAEVERFEDLDGSVDGKGEYKMRVVIVKTLVMGEEIFLDYGSRGDDLEKFYGFVCQCGGCRGL